MAKAEIISWYRIFEMFHFDSFHMYGIILSAVLVGMIGIKLIKFFKIKNINNEQMIFPDKEKGFTRYMLGGIIFGLGWALVGACPGPMFVLLGYGYLSVVIIIIGAILGTYIYGTIREKLPH